MIIGALNVMVGSGTLVTFSTLLLIAIGATAGGVVGGRFGRRLPPVADAR